MPLIKTHKLKIKEKYAMLHHEGVKPWEIRKNDRDFKTNEKILFIVIDEDGNPTGYQYTRTIKYIFHGEGKYGLATGFCILTLK